MSTSLTEVIFFWNTAIFALSCSSSAFHHSPSRRACLSSSGKRYFMCLAGTPATIEYGATALVTIEPAATTAPLPISTPSITIARAPIQTSLPINVRGFIRDSVDISVQVTPTPLTADVNIGDVEAVDRSWDDSPIWQSQLMEQNDPISERSSFVRGPT